MLACISFGSTWCPACLYGSQWFSQGCQCFVCDKKSDAPYMDFRVCYIFPFGLMNVIGFQMVSLVFIGVKRSLQDFNGFCCRGLNGFLLNSLFLFDSIGFRMYSDCFA